MTSLRNSTILTIILYFYVACAYLSLTPTIGLTPVIPTIGLTSFSYWHLALIYWFTVGTLLRHGQFLMTQLISLFAVVTLLTIIREGSFAISFVKLNETITGTNLPLVLVLFVVGPAVFFSFTFDPYMLVKELPRIINVRFTAYLLLLLSSGEMFRERFKEVAENLKIRGIDLHADTYSFNLRKGARRIRYALTYLPSLLRALVQEAAYRQSYALMLGCSPSNFPVRRTHPHTTWPQKIIAAFAILLLAVRLMIWAGTYF